MVRGDWTIHSTTEEYTNPWISVVHHEVTTPGGTTGIYGEVVFKNKAIGIIPIDDQGYTYLVGQYRFPLQRFSWEIPEGGGPLGESSLESAKRELKEEIGCTAQYWEPFLEIDLSNSVTNEVAEVFLATELSLGESSPEETENLEVRKLHFSELYNEVVEGKHRDSITVAAVLKLGILRPELIIKK